ncbi:MAG: hypothetical protein AB8B84_01565 [Granulosicoccus sp.]
MSFKIRQLGISDKHLLRELSHCFGQEFDDSETYESNQPSDEYLQDILASTSFIALAALSEQKVIGGLVAYELKKFKQARSEIYIYDLNTFSGCNNRNIALLLNQHRGQPLKVIVQCLRTMSQGAL